MPACAGTLGWMPWTYCTYPDLVLSPPTQLSPKMETDAKSKPWEILTKCFFFHSYFLTECLCTLVGNTSKLKEMFYYFSIIRLLIKKVKKVEKGTSPGLVEKWSVRETEEKLGTFTDGSCSVDCINCGLVIPINRQMRSDGVSDIYFNVALTLSEWRRHQIIKLSH